LSDLGFVIDLAVGANMEQSVAAFGEDAADEQAAMAMGWVFFAAHEGDSKLRHSTLQALDGSQKGGICGSFAIENATGGVIEGVAFGTAAQFLAKKEIFEG
jgi:hypothetical protein